VAFAFEVRSRRRRARSSSVPPAVVRTMRTEKPDALRPSLSRSAESRRRTLASARNSDSRARWASGSPGTSIIVAADHRAAGGRDVSDAHGAQGAALLGRTALDHRDDALGRG